MICAKSLDGGGAAKDLPVAEELTCPYTETSYWEETESLIGSRLERSSNLIDFLAK